MTGFKLDQGKLRWALLPFESMIEVVEVLTKGARKYRKGDVDGAHNWQKVENPKERYFEAAIRHLIAWWTQGALPDEDLGTHPLANAICCLLFLMWFDFQESWGEKHALEIERIEREYDAKYPLL